MMCDCTDSRKRCQQPAGFTHNAVRRRCNEALLLVHPSASAMQQTHRKHSKNATQALLLVPQSASAIPKPCRRSRIQCSVLPLFVSGFVHQTKNICCLTRAREAADVFMFKYQGQTAE